MEKMNMDPINDNDPSALIQVTVTILLGLAFAAVTLAWAH